jgi:hypothetical protein
LRETVGMDHGDHVGLLREGVLGGGRSSADLLDLEDTLGPRSLSSGQPLDAPGTGALAVG